MSTNYYEKRDAVVQVGLALERAGWRLYGWKDDQSDIMTDYYSPASWDGVAEKSGYVCCVNVGSYTVKHSSGGNPRMRYVEGEACDRCEGSGIDPLGWTLDTARADPRTYHQQVANWQHPDQITVRALLPDTISPLQFIGYGYQEPGPENPEDRGKLRCQSCSGRGHMLKPEDYVDPWPKFQANPAGCLWHVEKDGKILDSGRALHIQTLDRMQYGDAKEKRAGAAVLKQLIARIEAACAPRSERATPSGTPAKVEDVTIRRNEEHNGIEVIFPAKPDRSVLDTLKSMGFRWSGNNGLWYARYSPALLEKVTAALTA